MSQANLQCGADDPLDHTFDVSLDETPASARLTIDDDATPSVEYELSGELRVRGRTLPVTFKPKYPTLGVGTRDTGEYVAELDRPLHAFSERCGDFILGAATALVIPDDVGDQICEHFDIDTLAERKNEVAEESFKSQLRARLDHGDDDFRDEVEALLKQTE